jgi:hypothetical protein
VNQEYSIDTFDEHVPLVSIRDASAITVGVSIVGDGEAAAPATADKNAGKKTQPASATASAAPHEASTAAPVEGSGTTVALSRPKRTIAARTVELMVVGVGVVKVAKFSLDADDSGFNKSLIDKRAARQKEHQSLLYITDSGRQVAGRDYHHQVCLVHLVRVFLTDFAIHLRGTTFGTASTGMHAMVCSGRDVERVFHAYHTHCAELCMIFRTGHLQRVLGRRRADRVRHLPHGLPPGLPRPHLHARRQLLVLPAPPVRHM